MPTDPYVAERSDEEPRQEPNLSPGVRIPPAHTWRADRPGDLVNGVQPHGAMLGSPGPNIGYALFLVRRMSDKFECAEHEHEHDVEAVVGALAMKRASSFGRAPIAADIECAALALGYLGARDPGWVEWRTNAVDGASHDYEACRTLCDGVPIEELRLAPMALAPRTGDVHARVRASV